MHATPDFHSFLVESRTTKLDENPGVWLSAGAEAGHYTPEGICAGAVYFTDLDELRADRDLRLLLGRCLRERGGLVHDLAPPPGAMPFAAAVVDLINPLPIWPWPLSVDQAFEAYRWMVETHDQHGDFASKMRAWGYLFNKNEKVRDGVWGVRPIRSMSDLKDRLQSVVLLQPRGRRDVDWRRRMGLLVDGSISVDRAAFGPFADHSALGWQDEYEIGADLDRMGVGTEGVAAAVEPKPLAAEHPLFRPGLAYDRVQGLCIDVDPAVGFRMALRTTPAPEFRRAEDDYAHLVLAASRAGETFVQTLARARDAFDALSMERVRGAISATWSRASRRRLADELAPFGVVVPPEAAAPAPGL